MPAHYETGLMWFRRDLRAHDNAALHHALRICARVFCVFVYDRAILDPLPRADRRVEFIHGCIAQLHEALRALSPGAAGGLIVLHEDAATALPALAARLGAQAVFANHDDEKPALGRDAAVAGALAAQGRTLHTFKDHVVFERQELLTQGGKPYSVFTPYKRAWLAKADDFYLRAYPVEKHAAALAALPGPAALPSLQDLGFVPTNLAQLDLPAGTQGGQRLFADFEGRMARYGEARDFPAVRGPSYLSVHLRFGTLSIRELAAAAHVRAQAGDEGAATWLSELIWRDFYMQVLVNFPHVADETGWGGNFRPEYDRIAWDTGPQADALFQAWCEARTGFPLVDAAMAQLLQTGYMHNRLRMVVASFLCKDLGIDWRRGERFFALHLNDYELASNNGGWQWASSTGCDAQPYFRIFNPVSQSMKFDPEGRFILRYLPQLAGLKGEALHAPWTARPLDLAASGIELGRDYPRPVVMHDEARERTLARYAVVKKPAAAQY